MNFSIEKDVFVKALGRIQGIVEKRNTIPVLSNVLLEGKDVAAVAQVAEGKCVPERVR